MPYLADEDQSSAAFPNLLQWDIEDQVHRQSSERYGTVVIFSSAAYIDLYITYIGSLHVSRYTASSLLLVPITDTHPIPSMSRLQVDTYIPPLLHSATGNEDPNKQWWSPIVCTLLHTPTEALLVDTDPTLDQTEGLADWVNETIAPGCKLKYFYATHAHGDHILGFPALKARFPGVTPIATAKVAEGIKGQYAPGLFEYWRSRFPEHEMSEEVVEFSALPANNEISLDGHVLKAHDVSQGDCDANSYLHVPELSLVVAGDLVYGACHVFLGQANTAAMRAAWIDAVKEIEATGAGIVIPGHKRRGQLDGAYMCRETIEYIEAFGREREKAKGWEELEKRMNTFAPERWNGFILEGGCRAAFN